LKSHARSRTAVLALILTGYLLVVLDVSILMAALPSIRRELGFSPTGLSWAQNAYTLAFGGLLLLGARAGDTFGRRRMFTVGVAGFAAASLAVGLAQSQAWLIGARALQGVAAAIVAPSTLALLSVHFAEGDERTRAMAAYGALAGLGTTIGLILGGAFTSALSWRFGFFINVPVGIAAAIAAPRLLDERPRRAGRLDLVAALSSTAGVSALVYGIVRSDTAGWADPMTIASLSAGTLLVALFVVNQRTAAQPLMPLRLVLDRARGGAYATRFLFNAVLVSFYFFLTQYLQGVRGYSPLEAGLAFLPVTVVAFAAASATTRLTRRVGSPALAATSIVAMLAGTAWLSRLSVGSSYVAGLAFPMVLFGIGQGLGLSALTTTALAGVAAEDASAAGGLVNVAHHIGGALGLGVLVTVFAAAGGGAHTMRELVAERTASAFSGATLILVLALVVTVVARPRGAPERLREQAAAAV
jgi:EmrB/QacA subfamily drug resistance transporter